MQEVREDWPYALDCDHEDAIGEAWEACEKVPGFNGFDYESDELTRLNSAKKSFSGSEVEELAVMPSYGRVDVQWKCPVCGKQNEETHYAEDFIDD